ncbi:sugar diacid recognition domain-containing protein [Bacillus carboniphilus]|uniref:Sugar diacid recognition domain-containing protein n=1 Tax=Bacillus carboniphilus TaxID=86663 RepID=A0ABP3FFG3_9BACI
MMNVPEALAQVIVDRMKEIINQDINFIDVNCIIIASTDQKRIGKFHGGAQTVLKKKDMLVITSENQYEGTRKGINLPVYFEDTIVGIIGITGSEEEVSKYGKIIQSMTEILIKEAYIVEQNKIERESQKQFIEEILFRIHEEDRDAIKMRSELLNIKLDIPRVVLVARIHEKTNKKSPKTPVINEKIYNFIKRFIEFDPQNFLIQSGMNYILILNENSVNDIKGWVENIHSTLLKEYKNTIYFGIGSLSHNEDELSESYQKARGALKVALSSKDLFYVDYSELDLEVIIDDLSDEVKKKYLHDIFKNMDERSLNDYMELLSTYFRNNGSIMKTADELFLHKNTLQYKLNKIKSVTGYDPRITRDLVVLFIAVLIYKSEQSGNPSML